MATLQRDRAAAAAARARLAADKANGNDAAIAADAKALHDAQVQLAYDKGGWEPPSERGGHGAHSHSH